MYGIIPAAGSGSRMGELTQERAKILLPIGSQTTSEPVLAHTLRALAESGVLKGVVLVTRPEDSQEILSLAQSACGDLEVLIASGGATRQESVKAGLQALAGKAEFVLVHDAARPCCPTERIQAVATKGRETGAALLAIPVKSTLKRVNKAGVIEATVPRADIWEAQTPQVFSYELLCRAHDEANVAGYVGTDDCELVERLGHAVSVVEGVERNIKLTTPADLELAQSFLP